jgi:hypothetical protein
MKRTLIFFVANLLAISAFSQDWRDASYMRNPTENFISVNAVGEMMMGDCSDLNPYGYGFTVNYQFKTKRKPGNYSLAQGFGGYLGLTFYHGKNVNNNSFGTSYVYDFSKYEDFALIPMMLSYNVYLTHKKFHYFVGIDAGAKMMLKERDYKQEEMIHFYNEDNDLKITRFLPSGKIYIGAMYELNQDFRLRAQIGYDYTFGYKFDAVSPFYYSYDGLTGSTENRNDVYAAPVGEIKTSPMKNLSISIGMAYSL